jgi:hypothetical protein
MPARTPEDRALIARIANATRLGKTADRADLTAAARKGLHAKFEREALAANPNLSGDDLARCISELHRAHMFRMTLKAAQGRRKAREGLTEAQAAETELGVLASGAA